MPELLIEVGCEEIPAGWLNSLTDQIQTVFATQLEKEALPPGRIESYSTPRRLVVCAELPARQADSQTWGPPLKVARNATGQWTPAAQGFARKMGVEPDQLGVAAKDPAAPNDLYLFCRIPGREATEILPRLMGDALRALDFPKRMSWDAWLDDGKGAFSFGRPIRWIVALFDGQVVPFTIYASVDGGRGEARVTSGAQTFGHRFLPPAAAGKPIPVKSFADLARKLGQACVLLDPLDRVARLKDQLARRAGAVADDHGLLAEWVDLVEYPTVVVGRIPEEFHELPAEVLQTVLVHHQKYIPLVSPAGAVTAFAAVINGGEEAARSIVRGMERVVVARLRDAAFFYREDRKRPLADRVGDLAGVTFHRGLGSYLEKAERTERLIEALGEPKGLLTQEELVGARAAARLAKADLTTLMVREFPELQGVMGALYLEAQGERREIAQAVRWHYHPVSLEAESAPAGRFNGDEALTFAAVALADKVDTLAGYFGLGLVPSGSSDPYGLRRTAQGVLRVLLDFWPVSAERARPNLRSLCEAAVAGYPSRQDRSAAETLDDLGVFLLDRLRYALVSRGFAADEVEAVLGAREPDPLDDPYECWLRLAALHRVRSEAAEDFEHLAVAFKRAKNILAGATPPPVDAALFEADAERELHAAVQRLGEQGGGYEARLRALARLRGPIDRFFDDVLVMAEDPRVRANRLGLLALVLALFYRVADVSRLG